MHKIREISVKIQGFQYDKSKYLIMAYYNIGLSEEASNMFTTLLPWIKYRYKRLTMGVINSLDIFQEKMNKMFHGF